MKSKIKVVCCFFSVMLILLIATNVSFSEIFSLPKDIIVSQEEINEVNSRKKFGVVVQTQLEEDKKQVSNVENKDGIVTFKLFGIIPIRKVNVKIAPEEDVFIGGVPIGVALNSSGVVATEDFCIDLENYLEKGDIIYEINGNEISELRDVKDIANIVNLNDDIQMKIKRKDKIITKNILKNDFIKMSKANLTNENISGVGTLTYINSKTNDFGALGHSITDEKNLKNFDNGNIYTCNLLGIKKGEKNKPGQLRCIFLESAGSKGTILKTNKYGVFGRIYDKNGLVDENLTSKIGGRLSVNSGKATIVSSISGIREEYEIEIIKTNYQAKADDKSIVFRVVDQKLLDLTGGIVQGMSGSPIMQNGKMVGAVTHVFVSDPTKGYGVYTDWMLLNS